MTELALGAPLALLAAATVLLRRGQQRSRRERIAAALHELRRPLQAMVLAVGSGRGELANGQAGIALSALADLEQVLGGGRLELRLRPLELRPLIEAAVESWTGPRGTAAASGPIELSWSAGDARTLGDAPRLGQAIDNLIANAVEHGDPPVLVRVTNGGSNVRLSVANPVSDGSTPAAAGGSGLRIVSAIAAAHGGRFLFDLSAGRATAMLELPLLCRSGGHPRRLEA